MNAIIEEELMLLLGFLIKKANGKWAKQLLDTSMRGTYSSRAHKVALAKKFVEDRHLKTKYKKDPIRLYTFLTPEGKVAYNTYLNRFIATKREYTVPSGSYSEEKFHNPHRPNSDAFLKIPSRGI